MFTIRRVDELDLTILSATEKISGVDVMDAMNRMYGDKPTRLVLWDLTSCDVTGVNFEDVQAVAGLAVEFGKQREGARTAIVTSQQVTFGINRVYEEKVGEARKPIEVHVCWTLEEAKEFLGIESIPDS